MTAKETAIWLAVLSQEESGFSQNVASDLSEVSADGQSGSKQVPVFTSESNNDRSATDMEVASRLPRKGRKNQISDSVGESQLQTYGDSNPIGVEKQVKKITVGKKGQPSKHNLVAPEGTITQFNIKDSRSTTMNQPMDSFEGGAFHNNGDSLTVENKEESAENSRKRHRITHQRVATRPGMQSQTDFLDGEGLHGFSLEKNQVRPPSFELQGHYPSNQNNRNLTPQDNELGAIPYHVVPSANVIPAQDMYMGWLPVPSSLPLQAESHIETEHHVFDGSGTYGTDYSQSSHTGTYKYGQNGLPLLNNPVGGASNFYALDTFQSSASNRISTTSQDVLVNNNGQNVFTGGRDVNQGIPPFNNNQEIQFDNIDLSTFNEMDFQELNSPLNLALSPLTDLDFFLDDSDMLEHMAS